MLTLAVAVAFPKLLKPATGQCDRVVRQHYILVGEDFIVYEGKFSRASENVGQQKQGSSVFYGNHFGCCVTLFFF